MQIFVALGTHKQQFNRLLKALDKLAESNGIDAEIFAQIGNSDYEPKNFPFRRFLNPKEYEQRMKNADIIISHAGAGSIITALKYEKPLVVVPRLKRFGEHTNDHQIDLAKALAERGKVLAVFDLKDLLQAIEKAKHFKPETKSDRERLIARIRKFLEECSCNRLK
jgi:UDP-N-acetylglucosamine transferase subunit ALG13